MNRHDPNNPNCRFTYDWSADSATDYCTCDPLDLEDDFTGSAGPREYALDPHAKSYLDNPTVIEKGGHEDKINQKQHWLIITNNNEDVGQDNYEEDLDWEIEHSPDCPYEVYQWEDGMTHKEYKCLVGEETAHNGLDGLELITGTGDGWRELEEGRYQIEAWSQHDSFTGEWDGGLRFV